LRTRHRWGFSKAAFNKSSENISLERTTIRRHARIGEPHDRREGNPMEVFFSAFVGGLLGTALMDVVETLMERVRVTSGSG